MGLIDNILKELPPPMTCSATLENAMTRTVTRGRGKTRPASVSYSCTVPLPKARVSVCVWILSAIFFYFVYEPWDVVTVSLSKVRASTCIKPFIAIFFVAVVSLFATLNFLNRLTSSDYLTIQKSALVYTSPASWILVTFYCCCFTSPFKLVPDEAVEVGEGSWSPARDGCFIFRLSASP